MCCSVHRHKIDYIFSDSEQILTQDNSVISKDYNESQEKNIAKKFGFQVPQFSRKLNSNKIFAFCNFSNMWCKKFKQTFWQTKLNSNHNSSRVDFFLTDFPVKVRK